ncbi:glutamate-cysteine ligase family protein [Kaarinaea lacus]
MGQEISGIHFSENDFARFHQRLVDETELLKQFFLQNRFSDTQTVSGFELEAWLMDRQFLPCPKNAEFIQQFASPMVTPELASFNVEFNYTPQQLTGQALRRLHLEMQQLWDKGTHTAHHMDCHLAMIGILPTVRQSDLSMAHISGMKRYEALNEQVLRLREGKPLQLNIHGLESLRTEHNDVMLESATTSFQIHLQVPLDIAMRAYNASIILSAPMVAVSANSPFLFGKNLWAETRIPLFEQSVEVGGYGGVAHGPLRRVTFGSGYARKSIVEVFIENLDHYPVLLPTLIDEPLEQFSNVRLHNGTLWRWNRPLIGIDSNTDKGKPHLRIEHRVVPAGPSIIDSIANAALYYGLAYHYSHCEIAPEIQMPFEVARDNFYHAAQHGLDASLVWIDRKKYSIQHLVIDVLLPLAFQGLSNLGIDESDAKLYLDIIEARVKNNCNGAAWQRAFVAKHGADMPALIQAYVERQNSGEPVHEWSL